MALTGITYPLTQPNIQIACGMSTKKPVTAPMRLNGAGSRPFATPRLACRISLALESWNSSSA